MTMTNNDYVSIQNVFANDVTTNDILLPTVAQIDKKHLQDTFIKEYFLAHISDYYPIIVEKVEVGIKVMNLYNQSFHRGVS